MYQGKTFKAIVLAGGSGLRMKSDTRKQYLKLRDIPMLVYALKAFEESPVDEIVLVVKTGEEESCRRDFVDAYGLTKVTAVTSGGAERYHSSAHGIMAGQVCDYVLIHDAARPCISQDVIRRCMDGVITYDACIAAVPTIDTISVVTDDRMIQSTPNRNYLWSIQTPQTFSYPKIREAYRDLLEKESSMSIEERKAITDDASVYKRYTGKPVHVVEGSYENIKVTTPVDLKIAELFLA